MVPVSVFELEHDKILAGEIRLGNQLAFAAIYDRYHKQLYALAFRYLKNREMAEDAVQEIFVNFWINRQQLDEKLNVKSLFFTSLKNHTLNVLRNNQNAIVKNYEVLMDSLSEESTWDTMDETLEMTTIIEAAVEDFSPQRKLIFYLKNTEKLSNIEIGTKLQISVNTVKAQYSHILKEIRKYATKSMGSSAVLFSILFR